MVKFTLVDFQMTPGHYVQWYEVFTGIGRRIIYCVPQLLQKKPSERLCCGRRDPSELRRHPFFRHIQWSQLEAGHIPAPYEPNVRLNLFS